MQGDPEDSDNQQVQVAAQIDTNQEQVVAKKTHKGITERFNEKMNQDVEDQEKAQDIINTVQRNMNRPKQSLLDRESERLIREQDEELANEEELVQQE